MNGPETLTVAQVMNLSSGFLARKGSTSPRLDAQILTAHALGIRRLDLYLAPDRPLSQHERDTLRQFLVRRAAGEPVAYIVGFREFFGLNFRVTPAVLIPRPETEAVVDAALSLLELMTKEGRTCLAVADVGTGSGAIACTMASRKADLKVVASDISQPAIDVAKLNAVALGVANRIEFIKSDVLEGYPEGRSFDLIVSNPPYIADDEAGMVDASAIGFEPGEALFSGAEGTDMTFALVHQSVSRLHPWGGLAVEIGTPAQAARVQERMQAAFKDVSQIVDPSGVLRGFVARFPRPDDLMEHDK